MLPMMSCILLQATHLAKGSNGHRGSAPVQVKALLFISVIPGNSSLSAVQMDVFVRHITLSVRLGACPTLLATR